MAADHDDQGAYYNEDRAQKYYYSDRIFSIDLGLIARPG